MIDLKTVVICAIFTQFIIASALYLYWKTQKTYPGFFYWFLGVFVFTTGQIFFASRDIFPDFLTIVLANTLFVLTLFLRLEALNLYFTDRSFRHEIYLIFIPLIMALYFFTEYTESAEMRNVIFSAMSIMVLSKTVHVLLTASDSNERLFSKLFAAIYVFSILILFGRILQWSIVPSPHDVFNLSSFNIFLIFFVLIDSLGTTILFLFLNFQRITRELDTSRTKAQDFANRYSLAVSSAKAGIWDMDLKNSEIYWDGALEKLFGPEINIKEKLNDIWTSFEFKDGKKVRSKRTFEYNSNDEYLIKEFTIHRNDDYLRYLKAHTHIVRDDTGSCRVIGLIYDITPQRKAEQALKEAHKKLNLLTSITRHDILNSVNGVNGFAAILIEQLHDIKLRKMAQNIAESGAMITHLISFTAQYQNLGMNDPQWQDIAVLLDSDEFKLLAGGKSLSYPQPGTLIYADVMLEKVIYNLIENSFRHAGKITAISFSYEFSEDGLNIVYQDDGIGVPEENKNQIFERGFGKNTGLGLFFCREILEITGLTIKENGKPDQGARFEINVPRGVFKNNNGLVLQ